MSIAPGTRVGAYEVLAPLGAGGMGEVYRARDTRLGRDVALKVLPVARHADPDQRARFEREAQTLAALSHPRIAAIYDIVGADGHNALVMELVSGPTLAEVVARGPVPLRAALSHAIDIADALAGAHALGIVHRDLKPSNIVITADGSAKVLDFGIAKLGAIESAEGDRSTMRALTDEHAIVGTLGYLSPEQANGRPVDGRSDIFSLGSVMHEMISGVRAFHGDSAAQLLSSVLRDDPAPLRTLVPSTPRALERCVARCLEKDPRRRYQTAADLKAALEDLREDLSTLSGTHARADIAAAVSASGAGWRARRAATYAAIGLAGAAVGALATGALQTDARAVPIHRPFITDARAVAGPAWSPDGRTLAYSALVDGGRQVFVRAADASQSTQLTRQSADDDPLFWSPDGSRIYYMRESDHALVSVGAGGGEPQVAVASALDAPRAIVAKANISTDGRTLIFAAGEPGSVRLWSQDTRTGEKRPMDPAGMPASLANVEAIGFAPDDKRVAIIATTAALNQSRGVWIVDWPSRSARYYFADAPYLTSNPTISWLDGRRFVTNGFPLHGGADRLLIADVDAGTLAPLTGGQDDEASPTVTADGSRIAYVSRRLGLDLVQLPLDGGPPDPLLATSRNEALPDMTASGMLAYVTDADGPSEIRVRAGADAWPRTIGGARGPERDRATQPRNVRLSPDGQRLAADTYGSDHLIWIYPTAGGSPVRLDVETTDQHGASWSPDGNWIAYRRMHNGKWQLAKVPLGGGAAVKLADSVPGGGATDWSPRGDWIAHAGNDGLHLVSPAGASRLFAGLRTAWFRFSRDGSRVFAIRRNANRRLELSIWDVESGREWRSVALPLPATTDIQGMALSADGSRVILGAGTGTSDIWILEQFDPPVSPWRRWMRRGIAPPLNGGG